MSENELFKIPEEALKNIKSQAEFEEFIQVFTNKCWSAFEARSMNILDIQSTIHLARTAAIAEMASVKRLWNQSWRGNSGCTPWPNSTFDSYSSTQTWAYVLQNRTCDYNDVLQRNEHQGYWRYHQRHLRSWSQWRIDIQYNSAVIEDIKNGSNDLLIRFTSLSGWTVSFVKVRQSGKLLAKPFIWWSALSTMD